VAGILLWNKADIYFFLIVSAGHWIVFRVAVAQHV